MKLVLLGSSSFAVPVFEFLFKHYEIAGVYTRIPKPSGRKRIITPTPVETWATEHKIPIHYSIRNFKTDGAQYAVIMSYGVIIPDDVLQMCRFINVHPSDLPKYRGPAPIREMLKNGDTRSAVCLINTVHDPDAGDIYLKESFDVDVNDTNETIQNKVSDITMNLLSKYLECPESYPPIPQSGTPIITKKTTKEDVEVSFLDDKMKLHNIVRAYGFARTTIEGHDLKVLKTQVDKNVNEVKILEVQLPGKKPISWKDFHNGYMHS